MYRYIAIQIYRFIDTQIWIYRLTDLEICRWIGIWAYIDIDLKYRQLDGWIDRQSGGWIDGQTKRDRQIERQIDRQVDRYIYIYTYTYIHTCMHTHTCISLGGTGVQPSVATPVGMNLELVRLKTRPGSRPSLATRSEGSRSSTQVE